MGLFLFFLAIIPAALFLSRTHSSSHSLSLSLPPVSSQELTKLATFAPFSLQNILSVFLHWGCVRCMV